MRRNGFPTPFEKEGKIALARTPLLFICSTHVCPSSLSLFFHARRLSRRQIRGESIHPLRPPDARDFPSPPRVPFRSTQAEEMRKEMEQRVELERQRAGNAAEASERLRGAREHVVGVVDYSSTE